MPFVIIPNDIYYFYYFNYFIVIYSLIGSNVRAILTEQSILIDDDDILRVIIHIIHDIHLVQITPGC